MGAAALFSPLASIVNILVRNPMAPVRIESIDCDVQIEPGRKVAVIESVRLASETIEPGQDLKAFVTLKPHKGERETVEIKVPIPDDFPEGPCEVVVCDATNSIRRQFRNDPAILEPHDLDGLGPDDPGSDRAEAHGRLPACPVAGARAVGQGPGAAEPAGQRPGRLRVEARDPDAADPHRHRRACCTSLGRRRHADAAVYRGQGCRAVVIVVSLRRSGPPPGSMTTRNEMSHPRSSHHVRIDDLRAPGSP